MNITVLGAGSWGTSIAILLGKTHNVTLYSHSIDKANKMKEDGENKEFLPGVSFPSNFTVTNDISVTGSTEMVVTAVPSTAIRGVLVNIAKFIKCDTIVVNISKGMENGKRISQIIAEELPGITNVAVLSGPSHAEEVSIGSPTAVVAASEDESTAKTVQDVFMADWFRVYTSTDVIGVELGGAVKNVIALAAGISDGLGYGDNAKAALMTRGISEITRLGVKMGGQMETFAGLTGIGDLIVTCTSMHSRNRRAGILIGKGMPLQEALTQVRQVVEGVYSAKSVRELSSKYGVIMPITEEINRVLFEGKNPKEAVRDLMTRDKKGEG